MAPPPLLARDLRDLHTADRSARRPAAPRCSARNRYPERSRGACRRVHWRGIRVGRPGISFGDSRGSYAGIGGPMNIGDHETVYKGHGVRSCLLPFIYGRFPGVAGYTAYLAPTISCRDETGLSSCFACPRHHAVDNHPVGECRRRNQRATPTCCLHPFIGGSTSEVRHFEATFRSLALRPDNSPSSSRRRCR